MAPIVIRPDNILKRAEELIAVGKEESALQTLQEFITSRKSRSVAPSALEPIANLFVQLCVDLRKGFTLKDGLHQFKKNVQVLEAGLPVVENVSRKLIELAENKLKDAQSEADISNEDYDLETSESPEDVLLSAISNDQSKDRADRELITPWVRFLWESYRLILDLLRNNSKLEVTYSEIVLQAYQFCLKFNRKTEFKRLCELLRLHVQNATQAKSNGPQVNAINLQDPETLQRYLDSRFQQLNVSVKLELWQEAFRSVEDIHSLINQSKRPPKPNMMVNYYESLAKIFLVSDNNLFHAAAWHKFINLYSQSPNATEEQLSRYSSVFLLSSLSIPQESYNLDLSEDYSKHSQLRLAALLNLPKVPTRESLIQNALTKNIYDYVHPTVKKLYQLLEADFHPLSIKENLDEVASTIQSNSFFAPYIKPLTKVILTRLFEQVSQVYESVKLEFLIQLATFKGDFELSPLEIESFLLNAGRDGQLSFTIDHDAGVITFQNDPFGENSPVAVDSLQTSPAELVRSQLSNLAKTLYASSKFTDASFSEKQRALRERLISSATEALTREREEAEKNRQLLEKRKELAELEKKEREAEAFKERQRKIEEEKVAEAKRVEEETKRRAAEKLEREREFIQLQEKKKLIEEINAKGIIKLDVDQLEDVDREKILSMQVEQLEKDKNELETRVKALFKKLDHTERAYRKYELPFLEKDASLQKDRDLKAYEEFKAKRIAAAKKEHEEALQIRNRLQKIVPDFQKFTRDINAEAAAKREALIKDNEAKLAAAKKERIEKIRQERYQKALADYEAHIKQREAEEAKAAAEAKARADREATQARLRAEYEAANAQAARQREIEAQALAKARGSAPSTGSAYRPPRLNRTPGVAPAPAPAPAPVDSTQAPVSTPSDANAPPKPLTYSERMKLKREGKLK